MLERVPFLRGKHLVHYFGAIVQVCHMRPLIIVLLPRVISY